MDVVRGCCSPGGVRRPPHPSGLIGPKPPVSDTKQILPPSIHWAGFFVPPGFWKRPPSERRLQSVWSLKGSQNRRFPESPLDVVGKVALVTSKNLRNERL